jgi:hypothetical protein
MFDIPLSEISQIHFKSYKSVSFIKVITKSNTIHMYNMYHYPISNIISSLETYLIPYKQVIIDKDNF